MDAGASAAHSQSDASLTRLCLLPMAAQHIVKRSTASSPPDTATHSAGTADVMTHIRVEVSDGERGKEREGECGLPVVFDCPVFLLQSGMPALSQELEEIIAGDGGLGGAACHPPLSLRWCRAEAFECIALYVEHFYGVHSSSVALAEQLEVGRGESECTEAGQHTSTDYYYQPPTVLQAPLELNDLYLLHPWEVAFVWQRLLELPHLIRSRVVAAAGTRSSNNKKKTEEKEQEEEEEGEGSEGSALHNLALKYIEQGRWIDALGTSQYSSVTEVAGEVGKEAPPPSLAFTLEEKQVMVDRLLTVMDAAGRLGVQPLRDLCAALIANAVIDLEEDELRCVLTVPTATQPVPPLTTERAEEVYQRYRWIDVRPQVPKKPSAPKRAEVSAAGDEKQESEGEAASSSS